MTEAVFWIFAAVAVVTASLCILSRSALSAVLWLTVTMLSLAAIYVLLLYQRTMHGPPRGVLLQTDPAVPAEPLPGGSGGGTATLTAPAPAAARLRITDLDRREIGVVAPLVALIIVLGVYPQPLIDLIRPAVSATISDVGAPDGVTPHTTDARPNSERGTN